MSNVNILRAVENIRSGTTVYTPLVEIIVNAIQAIEGKGNEAGQIDVVVERSSQEELEKKVPPVESFLIKDNGIGFTDARPSTGHVGFIKVPGHQVKDSGIDIESFRQLLKLPAELVFGVVIK